MCSVLVHFSFSVVHHKTLVSWITRHASACLLILQPTSQMTEETFDPFKDDLLQIDIIFNYP